MADHGHDDHGHGHGGGHSGGGKSGNRTDSWFDKLATYVSEKISIFVFSLFFLFGIGAIYGAYIAPKLQGHIGIPIIGWIAVPFILGMVALENRDWATILFVVFFLLILL